jgi:predicted DCC family thiol-disulfide oxidoreductase YuxK
LFAVPRPIRNAVYNLVARNRYRIFGKYETCFVPDAGEGDGVGDRPARRMLPRS